MNYDSKMLNSQRLHNSDILNNLASMLHHLNPEEREQLKQLIVDCKHLFSDVSSNVHNVDVGDSKPVKQHPYLMNLVKKECLRE